MRKSKLFTILAVTVMFAISVFTLTACGLDDPVDYIAIDFTGTKGDTLTSVDAATLTSDYGFAISADILESASGQAYTGVTQQQYSDYAKLYTSTVFEWAELTQKPVSYYHEDTAIVIVYDSATGIMTVLTVQVKSGKMSDLKQSLATVTYTYEKTNPAKTEYTVGDELDLSGFAIVRKGSDGTSVTLVKDTDYTLDITAFDSTKAGEYEIKYALKDSDAFSGSFKVKVTAAVLEKFKDGTATGFSATYTEGIKGVLTVTAPDVEGVTVSYRTKSESDADYSEWTQTAPQLKEPGNILVEVKFSKSGYEDKIIEGLNIKILTVDFENAKSFVISDVTGTYSGESFSATVAFTVPDGAALEFSTDAGTTWTKTNPEFKNAGEYAVLFRVTKTYYSTVNGSYKVSIARAKLTGVTAAKTIYVQAGQTPDFKLTGIDADDKLSYSVESGEYQSALAALKDGNNNVKIKIQRGNYECVLEVAVIAVPGSSMSLTVTHEVVKATDDKVYIKVTAPTEKYTYLAVRVSLDSGKTWSDWADLSGDLYLQNIPRYNLADTNEIEHQFLFVSDSAYAEYECTLALPYKILTSLEITAPTMVNYIVGDTFNPAGIVVKKVYDDQSTVTATVDEYQLVDANGNILTSQTLFETAANISVRARIGDLLSPENTAVSLSVYDVATMAFDDESSTIAIVSAPAKLSYTTGEGLDESGLSVTITIPSLFGDRIINLPIARVYVDAGASQMNLSGTKNIYIYATDTSGTIIDSLNAEFEITVIDVFENTEWYEDSSYLPLADFPAIIFGTNGTAQLYVTIGSNKTILAEGKYITALDESDNLLISFTADVDGKIYNQKFYYSVSDSLMYIYYDQDSYYALTEKGDNDIWLTVLASTPQGDSSAYILASDGKLSAEQINSFENYGKLYLVNEANTEKLITPQTVFSESVTIYCIFTQADYSGLPFIGVYYLNTDIIIIAPTSVTLYNDPYNYSAIESEEDWTISIADISLVYDKNNQHLTMNYGSKELIYNPVDTDKFAVVKIENADSEYSYQNSIVLVEKGKALEKLSYSEQSGTLNKYVFTSYNYEAITEDCTLVFTEKTDYYVRSLNQRFGSFELNFVFETVDGQPLFYMYKGLTLTSYSVEFTDFESWSESNPDARDALMFNVSIDEQITAVCIDSTQETVLIIENGSYEGTYSVNHEFYKGLPFIYNFTNKTGNIEIYENGNFNLSGEIFIYGIFELTEINGEIYTLLFKPYDETPAFTGVYDNDTRILTIEGEEYYGPALYQGAFSYQGEHITIDSEGLALNFGYFLLENIEISENGDVTFSFTTYEGTIVLLKYVKESDTLIYDYENSNTEYQRYSSLYSSAPFINYIYESSYYNISIDEEGIVRKNWGIIGQIADYELTADGCTFTVNYFDASTAEDAVLSGNTLTIGEAEYIYNEPIYEDQPFANQELSNDAEDKFISIDSFGKVTLIINNVYTYGKITEFDGEARTFTVTVDSSETKISFTYTDDSVTMQATNGDVVFTASANYSQEIFCSVVYINGDETLEIFRNGEIIVAGSTVAKIVKNSYNFDTNFFSVLQNDEGAATLTVYFTNNSVTYNGKTYTTDFEGNNPFNNLMIVDKEFKDDAGTVIKIMQNGEIINAETLATIASILRFKDIENGIELKLLFADNSVQTAAYSHETQVLTIAGVEYKSFVSYSGKEYVDVEFINGGDILKIDENGQVLINDSVIGQILGAYDDELGTSFEVFSDDTGSSKMVYLSNEKTIVLNGIKYSINS